jgi:uncharacterized protein YecE (DUF72 family)
VTVSKALNRHSLHMSKKDKDYFKVEELINKLHEVLQVIDKGMMEQSDLYDFIHNNYNYHSVQTCKVFYLESTQEAKKRTPKWCLITL